MPQSATLASKRQHLRAAPARAAHLIPWHTGTNLAAHIGVRSRLRTAGCPLSDNTYLPRKEHAMIQSPPALAAFIAEVEALVAAEHDTHDLAQAVEERLSQLLADPDFLAPEYREPSPDCY